MNVQLRRHAMQIVKDSIAAVLPDAAVKRALEGQSFPGRVILVAAGKAAWQMAHAARQQLGDRIEQGIVITKYGHSRGPIGNFTIREAGHPVPDENSFAATREALEMVADLAREDTVLFLLSGGGSALFEVPRISGEELQDITNQLLSSGADIVKINTIRKRLSRVKGGRFAQSCAPAAVFSIVLSDIVGDPLDMIASGPAYPDSSTCAQAKEIASGYGLRLSPDAAACLEEETPKTLTNVTTHITGSVRELCQAAADSCARLGYRPHILTTELSCQAREAGRWLAQQLREAPKEENLALIAGGETVVILTGHGKGGRNQELALAAAELLDGTQDLCLFSLGSDGTDGPTDAAGGYVDGDTAQALAEAGRSISLTLQDNDAYHALKAVDGLIITGPTGTNVNDVAVALVRRR